MSWDDGEHTKVKKVQLTYDDVIIRSVQVEYDGAGLQSRLRGSVGTTPVEFVLSPDEYIIEMTGYYEQTILGNVITALQFKTNKKTYGLYGRETRHYFSAYAPSGKQIAGFCGATVSSLNSIDVHIVPISSPGTTNPNGPDRMMTWDDGKHAKVKKVQLTYDDVIRSIQVEYDGTGLQSQLHGSVGTTPVEFTLSSDEYITELTGYYKSTFSEVITALTFKTNKKTYGPYGHKTNYYFSAYAPTGEHIAGFHGTSVTSLNSIDVHFLPISPPGTTTTSPIVPDPIVPDPLMTWDDGKHAKVKKVELTYDDVIRSIKVDYDGTALQSQLHGSVGTTSVEFALSPDEYITELTGYYEPTILGDVITALKFKTNKKTYGPYGKETRHYFSVYAPTGEQIAGFLGITVISFNHIDVHFVPISPPRTPKPEIKNPGVKNPDGKNSDGKNSDGKKPDVSDSNLKKVEAQGGIGGKYWDDGADHDGVKNIHVVADGYGISFIRFDYGKNTQILEGPVHGVKGRVFIQTFVIDHPKEYIISVEGWYSTANTIQGIQFNTNKRHSQYFGIKKMDKNGTNFKFEVKDKKIVGFHGFSDTYLHSIGAHFAPINSILS